MIIRKENATRVTVRKLLNSPAAAACHFSWVESGATSPGIPDLNYCFGGTEGWLELKCMPNIEVRAAQVEWIEKRIQAGGHPLILIQDGDSLHICHGSSARHIRADPSRERVEAEATSTLTLPVDVYKFLTILRNPGDEHRKIVGRSINK